MRAWGQGLPGAPPPTLACSPCGPWPSNTAKKAESPPGAAPRASGHRWVKSSSTTSESWFGFFCDPGWYPCRVRYLRAGVPARVSGARRGAQLGGDRHTHIAAAGMPARCSCRRRRAAEWRAQGGGSWRWAGWRFRASSRGSERRWRRRWGGGGATRPRTGSPAGIRPWTPTGQSRAGLTRRIRARRSCIGPLRAPGRRVQETCVLQAASGTAGGDVSRANRHACALTQVLCRKAATPARAPASELECAAVPDNGLPRAGRRSPPAALVRRWAHRTAFHCR